MIAGKAVAGRREWRTECWNRLSVEGFLVKTENVDAFYMAKEGARPSVSSSVLLSAARSWTCCESLRASPL